jgi:hypothetical protein
MRLGFPRANVRETRFRRLPVSNIGHSQHISAAKAFGLYGPFIGLFLTPGDDIAG